VDAEREAVVAGVVAQLGDRPHPLLTIELQWGDGTFDKAADCWRYGLELCAIVAAPGWQDSRYRSVVLATVPANDQAERSAAMVLAETVAGRLAVPCHTPDLSPDGEESGRTRFSRWIARQGEPPMVDFHVWWEAEYWLDDGVTQTATGVEVAGGRCGTDAHAAAVRALQARLGSDDGPVQVRCSIPALPRDPLPSWNSSQPRRHLDVTVEETRDLRRANATPTQIARSLLHRAPGEGEPTTMAVMWAMHEAFELPLPELAMIGAWRAGGLSHADVDAAIGPRLDARQPRWDLAHQIRHAHRVRHDVVAVLRTALRQHGTIVVVQNLRAACDLTMGLRIAVDIVSAVGEGDDARAIAYLEAAW
jgi:hypothetical protein